MKIEIREHGIIFVSKNNFETEALKKLRSQSVKKMHFKDG